MPAAKLDKRAHCGACKAELSPFDTPQEVNERELDEAVAHSSLPVLVDFWAPWCGPCRAVAPEIERLAGERQGQVLVLKVDTDRASGAAAKHRVQGIPTFVLFRGGREAKRAVGAMSASALAAHLGI